MKNIKIEKNCCEIDWKEEGREKDNAFVEEITRADPEWVKGRRLEYLENSIKELEKGIENFTKIVSSCNNVSNYWFAEFVNDIHLKPIFRKKKSLNWEKSRWEIKEYVPKREDEITPGDIEEAKKVPCSNFVKVVKEDSGRYKAYCPFHKEKTPSLCIYKNNNSYYTFCCCKGGDVISLVQRLHGMTFLEAVKYLLNK